MGVQVTNCPLEIINKYWLRAARPRVRDGVRLNFVTTTSELQPILALKLATQTGAHRIVRMSSFLMYIFLR